MINDRGASDESARDLDRLPASVLLMSVFENSVPGEADACVENRSLRPTASNRDVAFPAMRTSPVLEDSVVMRVMQLIYAARICVGSLGFDGTRRAIRAGRWGAGHLESP
jgi:hypothetical protein